MLAAADCSAEKVRAMAPLEAADPLGALACAAAAGDASAVRSVLAGVAPLVLRVVRGVLGATHPDVDDLVQEALVGVARALPSFRGECSVAHFAARIAARRTIDARRRAREQARRIERQAASEVVGDQRGGPASPGDAMTAERRRRLLRALLETLPEAQAEALTLRFVLDYSLGEVAEATSSPLNTVRSRLRLARERLRQRIEEDPGLADLLEVER